MDITPVTKVFDGQVVVRNEHKYCKTHIHYPGGGCQWDELANPSEPKDPNFGVPPDEYKLWVTEEQ